MRLRALTAIHTAGVAAIRATVDERPATAAADGLQALVADELPALAAVTRRRAATEVVEADLPTAAVAARTVVAEAAAAIAKQYSSRFAKKES